MQTHRVMTQLVKSLFQSHKNPCIILQSIRKGLFTNINRAFSNGITTHTVYDRLREKQACSNRSVLQF